MSPSPEPAQVGRALAPVAAPEASRNGCSTAGRISASRRPKGGAFWGALRGDPGTAFGRTLLTCDSNFLAREPLIFQQSRLVPPYPPATSGSRGATGVESASRLGTRAMRPTPRQGNDLGVRRAPERRKVAAKGARDACFAARRPPARPAGEKARPRRCGPGGPRARPLLRCQAASGSPSWRKG